MFRPLFRAAPPEGWRIRSNLEFETADAQVRVTVFEEPVPARFTVEEYADAYGRLYLEHFPGYREWSVEAAEPVHGLGRQLVRSLTWQPDGGEPLAQVQVYGVLHGRGVVTTGTAPVAGA